MNICRTPTGQSAVLPRALPALTSERKVPIATSAISIAGTIRQHTPLYRKNHGDIGDGEYSLKTTFRSPLQVKWIS